MIATRTLSGAMSWRDARGGASVTPRRRFRCDNPEPGRVSPPMTTPGLTPPPPPPLLPSPTARGRRAHRGPRGEDRRRRCPGVARALAGGGAAHPPHRLTV